LNNLPSIPAGGVTVVAGTGSSDTVGYQVTFVTDGAQPLIVPTFDVGVATTSPGSGSTPKVQTLTLPSRFDLQSTAQFLSSNFVGSIANIAQADATTFHFMQEGAAHAGFAFGDVPIDGLVADVTALPPHHTFVFGKNFVPEAFVTDSTLIATPGTGTAVLADNTAS